MNVQSLPLPNGHIFLGTTRDFETAVKAYCWRCGEVVKDRHGPITSKLCTTATDGVTFTNPTADKLGAEGYARTLAAVLAEERQKGRDDERARVTRIRNKAFAGKVLDDDMGKLLADFDGMLVRGEDDAT